jgi:hypothetical protein
VLPSPSLVSDFKVLHEQFAVHSVYSWNHDQSFAA